MIAGKMRISLLFGLGLNRLKPNGRNSTQELAGFNGNRSDVANQRRSREDCDTGSFTLPQLLFARSSSAPKRECTNMDHTQNPNIRIALPPTAAGSPT